MKLLMYLFFAFYFISCARSPLTNKRKSMRITSPPPALYDSLDGESFFVSLKKHIEGMKKSKIVSDPMLFGEKSIPKNSYIAALEEILTRFEDKAWPQWIVEHFDFYEVYGKEKWGEILATGYYEPEVKGSNVKTEIFSQPLYKLPPDLVTINLKKFSTKFLPNEKLGVLYGRIENQKVLPYFERESIDSSYLLKNKNLELAWVSPLDAFFIQIQGTGLVDFSNGQKKRFGYTGENGHPYIPIGKFLTDFIPLEEMSMQKIKAYLEKLPLEEQQKILNKNPSYVFFKELESKPLTYSGIEVTPGRTIATDRHFFPKGALAFLEIEEPLFEPPTDVTPKEWIKKPRFVFDEDTGGAISGGGRVDLYFGEGSEASQKAGVMKRNGSLFYLVPKKF